jgi:hypothetical protein
MKTLSAILILGFGFTAQAQDKVALIEPDTSGAIFDQGSIVVDGAGGFSRMEDFVIFKHPDGEYTILSNIVANDGSYEASAKWTYDKEWHAKAGTARSITKGIERKIDIRRDGNTATMTRRTITADNVKGDEFTVACGDDCLIDMTPAVLPMAVMARRFDAPKTGSQTFKWIGVSLIGDQVLTNGTATISLKRTLNVNTLGPINHWRFVEDLTDPTGKPFQMNAHLWTDKNGHLRKFGMGRNPTPTTVGIRQTDESLSNQMPVE